jgi:hypothetical protein
LVDLVDEVVCPIVVPDESFFIVVDVVEFVVESEAISVLFADVRVKAKSAIEDAIHAAKKKFFFIINWIFGYTLITKILYQHSCKIH